MYVDIATLVRDALLDSGCDPSLLGNFDSHSTIALDFNELPSIYISTNEDEVWLWSRVAELNENVVEHCAFELLKQLMIADDFVRGGHLSLAENENHLELKALLSPHCVENKENFGAALSQFFERLDGVVKVIR